MQWHLKESVQITNLNGALAVGIEEGALAMIILRTQFFLHSVMQHKLIRKLS